MAELSTAELLSPTAAAGGRGAAKPRPACCLRAMSRIAQPFMALASALIGFSSLLLGAFSRFGLWRQVGVAVVLLLVVQAIATVATSVGEDMPGGWVLAYIAPVLGIAIGMLRAVVDAATAPRGCPSRTGGWHDTDLLYRAAVFEDVRAGVRRVSGDFAADRRD